MPAREFDYGHGITAIDTRYVRAGLAASHLIVRDGRAAFIDTGHTPAVPRLLAALQRRELHIEQVDYVMVTHVHLDHAGAAGTLMLALPKARLVVHPLGARHLRDPQKLIAGTRAVYGDEAFERLYGEVLPVPAERIIEIGDGDQLTLGDTRLRFLDTPGHARHHYCVHDPVAQAVFTGDTFGISLREFDVDGRAMAFATTTPVQFDPQALHGSIERLLALGPQAAFLTHFGRVQDLPRLGEELHRDIDRYVAIAERHRGAGGARKDAIAAGLGEYLRERVLAHGCRLQTARIDELLAGDVELNAQGLDVWLARPKAADPAVNAR